MDTLRRKWLDFSKKWLLNYRLRGCTCYEDIDLIFRLFGHIANSTGYMSEDHLTQFENELMELRLAPVLEAKATDAFYAGQQMQTKEFELSLRRFSLDKIAEELLLRGCWRFIWADRHLGVREYQLVHLWGFWLGWLRADIETLGVIYRPVYISASHREALELLEVTEKSPASHIKKMYKRQLSLFHPDKIMGAGGTTEDVRQATDYTAKIHDAYALIRMLHGF